MYDNHCAAKPLYNRDMVKVKNCVTKVKDEIGVPGGCRCQGEGDANTRPRQLYVQRVPGHPHAPALLLLAHLPDSSPHPLHLFSVSIISYFASSLSLANNWLIDCLVD
jgi:hypothetical protein